MPNQRAQSTVTLADATSLTPNISYDRNLQVNTQGAGTLTVNAPNGNGMFPGQKLELVLKTTAIQTYSFNAAITNAASGGPTASTAGKTDRILLEWNDQTSKWDIVAYVTN